MFALNYYYIIIGDALTAIRFALSCLSRTSCISSCFCGSMPSYRARFAAASFSSSSIIHQSISSYIHVLLSGKELTCLGLAEFGAELLIADPRCLLRLEDAVECRLLLLLLCE